MSEGREAEDADEEKKRRAGMHEDVEKQGKMRLFTDCFINSWCCGMVEQFFSFSVC